MMWTLQRAKRHNNMEEKQRKKGKKTTNKQTCDQIRVFKVAFV